MLLPLRARLLLFARAPAFRLSIALLRRGALPLLTCASLRAGLRSFALLRLLTLLRWPARVSLPGRCLLTLRRLRRLCEAAPTSAANRPLQRAEDGYRSTS